MTFPTGTVISTANVASPDSDPSLARADLYDLIVAFNQLIASVNAAQGVATLDGSGRMSTSYMPSTWVSPGNISLQPATGIVSIQNILRLAQIYTADLGSDLGTTANTAGDVCYLVDGDAGQPCIGVYDGAQWRIVRLATQVGDVGAELSAVSTLEVEADA